jgi:hypothetical protein
MSETRTVGVSLNSGIVYVTGTVNDVSVTWTLTGTNYWTATAARAADDIYRIAITAIDGAGNSSSLSVTLYYGLQLIRDRTAADVAQRTDKGFYNASDLNRVEAAVSYVEQRLNDCGFDFALTLKQDWTETDIPDASDMARYLGNVAVLRGALAVLPSTPELPDSMALLGWAGANAIEQVLWDVDYLVTQLIQSYFYCGEKNAGEV